MVDRHGCTRMRGQIDRKRPEGHVPMAAGHSETLDFVMARVAGAAPRPTAERFDRGDDAFGNQPGGVRGVPTFESGDHRSPEGGVGDEAADETGELFGGGGALL